MVAATHPTATRHARPPLITENDAPSQFATVPEAGHAAFWEQPEIWNRLLLEFVSQH